MSIFSKPIENEFSLLFTLSRSLSLSFTSWAANLPSTLTVFRCVLNRQLVLSPNATR